MAKPIKGYSNIKDFEADAQKAMKKAMESTVKYYSKILLKLAEEHIYKNSYSAKWYERTNWLKNSDAVETQVYNAFGKGIGGSIKFSKSAYDDSTDRGYSKNEPWIAFQHGNPDRYLEFKSYLEIMNDSSLIGEAFHFPKVDRGHFYDEFLDICKNGNSEYVSFDEAITGYFNAAMKTQSTGKISLYSPKKFTGSSSVGSPLSSSTSHIPSYDSSRMY